MAHDRVKVKAEHAEFMDRFFGIFYGGFAFKRVDRPPRLQDHSPVVVAHLGDVLIGAGRCARNGFNVKGHEYGLGPGLLELLYNLRLSLARPGAVPVFRQRFYIRPLRFDPGIRVGIAMKVDDSHRSLILIR